MMTLQQLAIPANIERVVGAVPTSRWNRSSPTLKRADGYSRESWFAAFNSAQRVRLVREFLLDEGEWGAALRFEIPKPGKVGTRCIDVPTVLGQAVQYVLRPWFEKEVEPHLGKWCLAYRTGQRFDVNCRRVHQKLKGCPWVCPLDVVDFYGSIQHRRLDSLVDRLDADDALKEVLCRLWRVQVIQGPKRRVVSRQGVGIPQGFVLSPSASNLYAASAWSTTNRIVSSRSAVVPNYCDDGLTAAPTSEHLAETVNVAREQLGNIGLRTTVDSSADIRRSPARWLGLEFHENHLDISDVTLDLKISQWATKAKLDLITREGAESSMKGLLAHYQRLLPSTRITHIQSRMEEGLASITFTPPTGRKEGQFLQSLMG